MTDPLPAHRPAGRFEWGLLLFASAGLLAASAYRAATFPLTHDEAISFSIFTWGPGCRGTSNDHLLNTLLMQACSFLFGDSEPSLRLPNVLAHAAYLAGSLRILRRLAHPALRLFGFALFNLNPFVLDFFFLARGYGLALAFSVWGLYWLLRLFDGRGRREFWRDLALAHTAGALAVLSHYSFLNFDLPLILASVWLILGDRGLRRFEGRDAKITLGVYVAHGLILAGVAWHLLNLRGRGELYFGGATGFFSDTVTSLVRATRYSQSPDDDAVRTLSWLVVGLFAAVALLCVCRPFRGRSSPCALLVVMTALAAALPVTQHRLFSTPFPVERAALPYVPLLAAAVLSAFQASAGLPGRRWGRTALLAPPAVGAALLALHFLDRFDARSCYTWHFDAHNAEALRVIDGDRGRHVGGREVYLGNSWEFSPSLNYYRVTRYPGWLASVTRDPDGAGPCDYIYAFERELGASPAEGRVRLASFPDIGTVVLRVGRPLADP